MMWRIRKFVGVAALACVASGCGAESPEKKQAVGNTDALEIAVGKDKAVFRKVSPRKYDIDYPEFYLLETEVTNRLYREYLRATGKRKDDTDVLAIVRKQSNPKVVSKTEKKKADDKEGSEELTGGTIEEFETTLGGPFYSINDEKTIWRDGDYPRGLDDHPVALLTLPEAMKFCDWLSKTYPDKGLFRLPTWNEWMIAAYGKSRKYPWGDQWDRELAHSSFGYSKDKGKTKAESVKARPKGRTPEGLYGMLGNVSEYIIEGDPTGEDYINLGARWMGSGFDDGKSFEKKPEQPTPRQDFWGYSHSTESRMDGMGFRVLLDVKKDRRLITRPRLFSQKNNAWRVTSD